MRAARFVGDQRVEIVTMPDPTPAPGEVLLEVAFCGLCGSDRKPYSDGYPIVPGHEVSGTVIDSNGTQVPVGTRAAAYLSVFCGTCRFCDHGQTNRCVNSRGLLGWTAPWGGGYAELMAVPAQCILPIDDALGLDAAVLLLDTLGTGWHCLRLADAQNTTRALVMGCGPLGLGVIAGLRQFGVAEVFASDLAPERRAAAAELGAQAVEPGEVACLDELPLIVEAVGSAQTLMEAIRVVAPGGRVVMLGENWQPWTFEPAPRTMLKDYSVIRSWYFPVTEFADNQRALLNGTPDPATLVSHTFPLEQLDEAFRLFVNGQTRKVLIRP